MEIKKADNLGPGGLKVTQYYLDCTNEQCGSHDVNEDGVPVHAARHDASSKLLNLLKASQNSTEHERARAVRLLDREKRKCKEIADNAAAPEPERKKARKALTLLEDEERKGRLPASEAAMQAQVCQERFVRQGREWARLVQEAAPVPQLQHQIVAQHQGWQKDYACFMNQQEKGSGWDNWLRRWDDIQRQFALQTRHLMMSYQQWYGGPRCWQ
uniref:Uncharacterized protein n=1 Tax=Alexandrium catenella TaxID=2925 RepID=A0A7S1L0Q9_ALECA|mmetsp:Transcript_104428/g.277856  ORF Transcript_104428/g.277856 Transcript_104428/m.277856 type:complete len:214 (+) Transcript_104428:1-642(+)